MKKLIATLTILATLITTTYAHAYPIMGETLKDVFFDFIFRYGVIDNDVEIREDFQQIVIDLQQIEEDANKAQESRQDARRARKLIEVCLSLSEEIAKEDAEPPVKVFVDFTLVMAKRAYYLGGSWPLFMPYVECRAPFSPTPDACERSAARIDDLVERMEELELTTDSEGKPVFFNEYLCSVLYAIQDYACAAQLFRDECRENTSIDNINGAYRNAIAGNACVDRFENILYDVDSAKAYCEFWEEAVAAVSLSKSFSYGLIEQDKEYCASIRGALADIISEVGQMAEEAGVTLPSTSDTPKTSH